MGYCLHKEAERGILLTSLLLPSLCMLSGPLWCQSKEVKETLLVTVELSWIGELLMQAFMMADGDFDLGPEQIVGVTRLRPILLLHVPDITSFQLVNHISKVCSLLQGLYIHLATGEDGHIRGTGGWCGWG